ncbi:ketopantoate reductase family protein [Archaeoglobus fulgidus]|jgi:2-dehydropantoate 2-reductase|uniref:2-dehydropantoate 2-reductase n=2 Tax=Archaeoglobus fulgidus TaxID=2234 RepID=A0A075WE70_ARCFL|nr:2-dehydropantoate 2-reductase [Archaeoglobus fulgidus]AIG98695.1 2-dehydropantoate 2-reductase [Archaeoglobus fulgidus DSM 8774]KUJ92879.1 MAG: Putative 2-dehydropantoate 2-reductase [Archaeoglobus fulgidus]KUK06157.1 MAG: Putative 2-dehydropantoate 2-reductase [Archaeoglobus fulgidus]
MRVQRVQIMGAGALGSLVGALIQLAGYDVIFVARGKQLEALKNGLRVSGLKNAELKVYCTSQPEDADITFVTVKAYDTETVAKKLAEVDAGVVCSLQNGVGNEEILAKYCRKVLGGVTTYGANLKDYGHVVYAGEGYTYVGEMDGRVSGEAEMVADVLRDAGIRAEAVEDIEFRIWAKAVVNAAINPITAICRVKNGEVVRNPHLWEVARAVADEGRQVMARMGYEFDAASEVRKVAEMTAENRSSMLQDLERGKRTEVEFINGAIVKKGEEFGIDCAVNRTLLNLVRGVESGL